MKILTRFIHEGAEGHLSRLGLGAKKATRGLREGGRSLGGHFSIRMLPETASGLILDAPIPRVKPNGWGKRD
jgi:hypothetical protein